MFLPMASNAIASPDTSSCLILFPPTCTTNVFSNAPSSVQLVPIDKLQFVDADLLRRNANAMKEIGYVKVGDNDLFDKLPFGKMDDNLQDTNFRVSLSEIIQNNFQLGKFQGSAAIDEITITHDYSLNDIAFLKVREISYLMHSNTLDLPHEMINRVVAGLPAILVARASGVNGKAITALQWANDSKLYSLELYELQRDPKRELKLLKTAHAISMLHTGKMGNAVLK